MLDYLFILLETCHTKGYAYYKPIPTTKHTMTCNAWRWRDLSRVQSAAARVNDTRANPQPILLQRDGEDGTVPRPKFTHSPALDLSASNYTLLTQTKTQKRNNSQTNENYQTHPSGRASVIPASFSSSENPAKKKTLVS